jgi:DNA polymerase elongation subunit (family B)
MLDKSILDNLEKVKKSVLVFDIETSAFYPSDNREVNIFSDFENYKKFAKVKWFGAYSYLHDKEYYFVANNNSAQEIMALLQEHNILCGFNSEEFDFPILVNNGYIDIEKKYLHVDLMQIMGTATFKNKSGYAFKNRGALMDFKFKKNSLRCMAETMKLEYLKGEINYSIFHKTTWTIEEEKEIIAYLRNDVMANKCIFEQLWSYWLPFAELLDVKDIYNLSWIRSSIASLTYKAACHVLNIEPTYSEKTGEAEEMGGNVYLPKYEESFNGWHIDVGSMHPHMISMANLPAEVNLENVSNSKRKIWHGNEIFKVKGYYDITEWHPLAKYIASKLRERIALKETDPDNPFIYTLKIFLNGLYGVIRSQIFEKIHTPNAGWDTCYLSQQVQALMKEMFEQFGFEVIQGDTDAVDIVALPGTQDTREYVQQCIDTIVEIIKDNFPFPIDTFKIIIEYRFDYLMVPFSEQPIVGEDGKNVKVNNRLVLERKAKKKNYLVIYKNKDEVVVKLVGLPIKKDNATALGIKIYEEVLKAEIIKNTRAKFPKSFIESKVNEYLQRPEAMELISQEYKVNAFSSYKTNCIQAQISKGYFKGMDGVIRLVKNQKIGSAGKGTLYCTIQEALDAKLTVAELDLEKVFNELQPFVEYKEPIKVACEILAKDDKALTELAEAYLATPEEPKKKKRGRPKKGK